MTSKAKITKQNHYGFGCVLLVKPRGPNPGGGGKISGGGPEKSKLNQNSYIQTQKVKREKKNP